MYCDLCKQKIQVSEPRAIYPKNHKTFHINCFYEYLEKINAVIKISKPQKNHKG